MWGRELTANDDDINSLASTNQLVDTLYINIFFFFLLAVVFEFVRRWKLVYSNRSLKPKLVKNGLVPPPPGPYPLSWVISVLNVDDDEFLKMVGLDAYMLVRYCKVLFRIAMFYAIVGITILTPIYGSAEGDFVGWNKYSLANIPNGKGHNLLWVPVVFCYLFSMFFCQEMYNEYKYFVQKRVEYLADDDVASPDTPTQTNYTVMVERIPSFMRSAPMLQEFFDKLFPGQVYSVELTLDLTELQLLTADRHSSRNNLEKAVAVYHATGKRPNVTVHRSYFDHHGMIEHPRDSLSTSVLSLCGFSVYDSIEHYSREPDMMNDKVEAMQKEYMEKRQSLDEMEAFRIMEVKNKLQDTLSSVGGTLSGIIPTASHHNMEAGTPTAVNLDADCLSLASADAENSPSSAAALEGRVRNSDALRENKDLRYSFEQEMGDEGASDKHRDGSSSSSSGNRSGAYMDSYGSGAGGAGGGPVAGTPLALGIHSRLARFGSHSAVKQFEHGAKMVHDVAKSGVENIAKSGIRTAEIAGKGALRGVLEATRTLELLTVGAYYKVASTAFVTFTTRVAACSSHQILLSHDHFAMEIVPAPNPRDIIWENVSIPERQIDSRKAISDGTLIIGAVFWSIVVTFITAISNLESISEEFPWIKQYSDTTLYKLLNNYLAIGILLILLVILPALFDFISRNYEGVKLESQIQNSIMTRFFYYTLANVYVSVGLGSIASSLHSILSHPSTILNILGASLPSFSIYFASLIIVKVFTGIPLEMLRIGPLLQVIAVKIWTDKKKCTRRELKTSLADQPMAYGWIYPNLLMVLMIMVTYSCISPLLLPMCAIFFGLAFLMYKYQLLYVYINDYQSGGFMWYAVFNRTMVALLCGVVTLVCYLAIRMTFLSGPFYAIFPLPFGIAKFWYHCQSRFERPSVSLSLESAMDLDRAVRVRRAKKLSIPHDFFEKMMFRQPSLAEGRLKPMPYRRQKMGDSDGSDVFSGETGGFVATSPSPFRPASVGAGIGSGAATTTVTPVYLEEDILADEKNQDEDADVEEQVHKLLETDSRKGERRSLPVISFLGGNGVASEMRRSLLTPQRDERGLSLNSTEAARINNLEGAAEGIAPVATSGQGASGGETKRDYGATH